MVTALNDRRARLLGLKAGAEDFLTKPVDRAELRVRVRNLSRLKISGDDKYSQSLEAEVGSRTADLVTRTQTLEEQAVVLTEQAALLDLAQDAIVVRDMRNRILFWSRGAEVMYGWSAKEALGRNSHQLLTSDPSEPSEQIERMLHRHGQWEGEAIHHKRDGTRVIVASRWALQRDAEGAPVKILSIDSDITDRKRAEESNEQQRVELARSNSELEQFAYVASHDLQEPLRMVSSYCGLLARRYKGQLDKDADEFIDYAVDGATRMKHLIDDLLHYSRVGQKDKPFTPIDSSDCVRAAVANLGVAIEEAHAEITCDPLPTVFADSGQLMQVFQNLIGNALKFRGDQDARIRISARCAPGSDAPSKWEFSVQDNGIGIEQQFKERVFVIFQRLHARDQYSGNGMGLAITKKIIERHGGRIWLESIPATGTTFFFTLRGLPSDSLPFELAATAGLSR
ncbi:MAG: PAS domain S-box protein [Nitrospiraceae bacterium]|nr:PAS domain S-box protein [Nitrospiraceae bacterium]